MEPNFLLTRHYVGTGQDWRFFLGDSLFMSGSCHLDRALNVKIGDECQIFVIVIIFNCSQVLQFGAHSRYHKDALTQKRSFLVICTTFRSDFRVGWKKSKQTFNTKFVIRRSVQMTWTRHKRWEFTEILRSLKYGFCNKSFRKDETLTSWTLFEHFFHQN